MVISSATVNEDLPCKNPNCASHGKPHFNCRCYQSSGIYAQGGQVESYCSSMKPHDPSCEYFANGGEAGANAIQNMIKMGALHSSDPIAASMMDGESGDHTGAVAAHLANVGAHGLLGLGKSASSASSKLKDIEKQKLEAKLAGFLAKLGGSAPVDADKLKKQLESLLGHSLGGKSKKYVLPAIIKALSSGDVSGISDTMDHAESIGEGSRDIDDSIENLFGGSYDPGEASEPKRNLLKDYVEKGQLNDSIQQHLNNQNQSQEFAEGGEVLGHKEKKAPDLLHGSDAVARHYPNQAMIMGIAKGRVNNYLNSIRPLPPTNGLPFDNHVEDRERHKEYESVLDLANHPMSIMDHVKKSTLTPSQVKHFQSLYPELHDHLNKKLTERIIKNRISGEQAPPYHVRQSMSLFAGAPMDSTFTPQSIQAVQAVFMPKQPMPQQPTQKPKRNTAKLDKTSQAYMTDDQAREKRQLKV